MRLEICIDVNDMERMAEFWQLALGYERGAGDGQPYLNLRSTDGNGPVVFLQRVPEAKTVKNRLHLDLYVDNAHTLIEQLVAAGATRLGEPIHEDGFWWQVMTDPESNEFCVMQEVMQDTVSNETGEIA